MFRAELHFDDSFVQHLPSDSRRDNQPRQVESAAYSFVQPTAVRDPSLAAWSEELASQLGWERPSDRNLIGVLAGNESLPGMRPYAACYGGHQFGHWAGQLGDGRAITLGEFFDSSGQRQDLQLKGAGPTPYSRRADGRAVLRSSIREFLCSEVMHHLGVPTTRALSIVRCREQVWRDVLYDGNPTKEDCAIVARVAPSFIRFGNFEIQSFRQNWAVLRQLADYVISHQFLDIDPRSPDRYAHWFKEICERTAVTIAHWMRVGFVHGVMNTDNMSILGLTIDYGPYGWLDAYDPSWTPNTTDAHSRRYRFGQQPQIAMWNLMRLAEAISPLFDDQAPLESGLESYRNTFSASFQAMLAQKLGFRVLDTDEKQSLQTELYQCLQLVETDMSIFFRSLSAIDVEQPEIQDDQLIAVIADAFYQPELEATCRRRWVLWLRKYMRLAVGEGLNRNERTLMMNQANPKYVLRNYLAQQAIDAAEAGDESLIESYLKVLTRPYDEQMEHHALAIKRPEWARHKVGCSMLSCSS